MCWDTNSRTIIRYISSHHGSSANLNIITNFNCSNYNSSCTNKTVLSYNRNAVRFLLTNCYSMLNNSTCTYPCFWMYDNTKTFMTKINTLNYCSTSDVTMIIPSNKTAQYLGNESFCPPIWYRSLCFCIILLKRFIINHLHSNNQSTKSLKAPSPPLFFVMYEGVSLSAIYAPLGIALIPTAFKSSRSPISSPIYATSDIMMP